MQAPQAAPRIDVVLDGFGINTSAGLVAMCEVVLIEGPGRDGRPVRILVDPAHVPDFRRCESGIVPGLVA